MRLVMAIFLLVALSAQTLMAQGNYNDYVQEESSRYKKGGIAMVAIGTAMIGGGAAMLTNDSKYTKGMGAALLAAGVGLDVGSVFMFLQSRKVLDEAREREEVPLSFMVSPKGAQVVWRF